MKKKNNVIYIDFTFKRKRINSKIFRILYKYVYLIQKVSGILPGNNSSKNVDINTKRQTSNY